MFTSILPSRLMAIIILLPSNIMLLNLRNMTPMLTLIHLRSMTPTPMPMDRITSMPRTATVT